MCRPRGKGFCPWGILQISRDRDDWMGLKIKIQKKKKKDFQPNPQKIPWPKIKPKKSHAVLSLKNSPERKTSLPVELWSQNKNRTLSGIFRLLLFLHKSSHPKQYLPSFTTRKKSRIEFLDAFWSENGSRLCLSDDGFGGNHGSVWTYLSFLFQMSKKERKICKLEMDFKKSFLLLF